MCFILVCIESDGNSEGYHMQQVENMRLKEGKEEHGRSIILKGFLKRGDT